MRRTSAEADAVRSRESSARQDLGPWVGHIPPSLTSFRNRPRLRPVSNRCVCSGVAELSLYEAAGHRGKGMLASPLVESLIGTSWHLSRLLSNLQRQVAADDRDPAVNGNFSRRFLARKIAQQLPEMDAAAGLHDKDNRRRRHAGFFDRVK